MQLSSGYLQEEIYSFSQKNEFLQYISPSAIQKRSEEDSCFVLAYSLPDSKIIGVLEYNSQSYIGLFFVHSHFQRNGIGTRLLGICIKNVDKAPYLNASKYSLVFYLKMGFRFYNDPISQGHFSAYPMIFTNFEEKKAVLAGEL